LSQIQKNASVSASNNIGSHLSERQNIYTVPKGLDEAEYVVFLLANPTDSKNEKQMIQNLKQNPTYEIIVEKEEFIIFRKQGIIPET
jgi:hypothetical protein